MSPGALDARSGRLTRRAFGHVEHRRGWIFLWMDDTAERVMVYLEPDHARAAAERLAENSN
jgi:hypothetical protein